MSIRRVKVLLIVAAILSSLTAVAWMLLDLGVTVQDVLVVFGISAAIVISATAFMISRGWLSNPWENNQNKNK